MCAICFQDGPVTSGLSPVATFTLLVPVSLRQWGSCLRSSGDRGPEVDDAGMRKNIFQLRFWVEVEGEHRISWSHERYSGSRQTCNWATPVPTNSLDSKSEPQVLGTLSLPFHIVGA